jgi:hypothetical protein
VFRCDLLDHAFVRQENCCSRTLQHLPFHTVVPGSAAVAVGLVDIVQKVVTVVQELGSLLAGNKKCPTDQDTSFLEDYLLPQF